MRRDLIAGYSDGFRLAELVLSPEHEGEVAQHRQSRDQDAAIPGLGAGALLNPRGWPAWATVEMRVSPYISAGKRNYTGRRELKLALRPAKPGLGDRHLPDSRSARRENRIGDRRWCRRQRRLA
jgi:hypothetical protein